MSSIEFGVPVKTLTAKVELAVKDKEVAFQKLHEAKDVPNLSKASIRYENGWFLVTIATYQELE